MRLYPFKLFLVTSLLFVASMVMAQEPPTPTPVDPGGIPEIIDEVLIESMKKDNAPKGEPADKGKKKTNTTEKGDGQDNDPIDENLEGDSEEEERKIKFNLRQAQLPEAKIWGQQFFRDQSISLFTRSRDIKAIDSYLLGIGDELAVTVWGATDYSTSVAIDEEGFINLSDPRGASHIPRLYIKEMRFSDAKKAITERLKNHVNMSNSQISIELNYSRSLTINITGEVFHPGSYTIPAVNTAFNALVAAGGPSQIGSVRMIKVVSARQPTRTLDVYKFMNNPNVTDEFFLHNNDYIYVPLADRVVEIEGAIERPFFYELVGDENLVELISFAGGLRPDAYRRNIQIIRYENDEEKLIDVNLAQVIAQESNFELRDGDRIKINPIKQAYANYITVTGAVKLPGSYQLDRGTTIYDVLMKAGIIRSAVMERIYIKRLREDLSLDYIPINVHELLDNPGSGENKILNPFDEIEVKYKSEFIDKYNVQVYGAVRKAGVFEFSDKLSLADVVYMANGLRQEASNSYVEISRLKIDGAGNRTYVIFEKLNVINGVNGPEIEGAKDFLLEPYDQIFVRQSKNYKAPKNVSIGGEITWPGTYTMANDGERVLDLIERAGGWTEIAFLKGAQLIRKGDGLVLLDLEILEQEGAESRFNYVLREGDEIKIPKIKDLVAIAGRINHPAVKENAQIAEKELELELEKATTELEKKEVLLARLKSELSNPRKINIPFHDGKRANFYIREYGAGIDRKLGGRQRLVYVRYANGLVKKTRTFLFFKTYPKVEKGAMVYVGEKEKKIKKKRNPINWYKVVTDSLALITSGVTVYALINALRQ